MTPFVALPPEHLAASRLAWRIARALVARKWSLESLAVSRRWQLRVGRARWVATAFMSLFFGDPAARESGAIYAIHFDGKGSTSDLERSEVVRELLGRVGYPARRIAGEQRIWQRVIETDPRPLLAELDRVAQAFGAGDRHRPTRSRARSLDARLAVIAGAVLARGTWTLESPGLWLRRDAISAAVSPMPSNVGDRPGLSTLLHVWDRSAPGRADLVARATSHGYVDRAGEGQPDVALMKYQPLTLRAALAEARFLEAEVTPGSSGAARRRRW